MFVIDCLNDIKKAEELVPYEIYEIIKDRETECIKNIIEYFTMSDAIWDIPKSQYNINTYQHHLTEDADYIIILNGDETASELEVAELSPDYENMYVPESVEYVKCKNGEEYTIAMILRNNESMLRLYIKGHIKFKYY